ncbi:MAG: CDP-alcohol phosphatidyltransferase family protein [Zetaproteobacteria bacterium]|nr:MAG: CDP-alcohol phosphatidyltransferase family protein [Zetaproteobacteria bacterium]
MAGAVSPRYLLSIPNILTLVRIVLTPLIAYALLRARPEMALLLLAAAGLSDLFDGAIARFFGQKTVVGAYLDPLADKLMLVTVMVTLFHLGVVPLYLFIAVIFRDALIVLGAISYELVTHDLKMEPTLISKATTAAQIILLLLLILDMARPVGGGLIGVATWITFALTVASGLHYLVVWTRKAVRATE